MSTNDNICTLLSFFNLFNQQCDTNTAATWDKQAAHIISRQFFEKSKSRIQHYLLNYVNIGLPAIQFVELETIVTLQEAQGVAVSVKRLQELVTLLSEYLSAQAEPFDYDAQVQSVLKAGLLHATQTLLTSSPAVPFNEEQVQQIHASKIAFSGGFMVPHECDFSVR